MYPQYIVLLSYKKDIILDSRTLILSFDKRSFGNEVKTMHQKCYSENFILIPKQSNYGSCVRERDIHNVW